jgi:hypothetical protein
MTFTQEQVERIVVEVIRRLGLLDTNPKRQRGMTGDGVPVDERSSSTAELRLSDKVISLRLLDGKLSGVTRLVIPHPAIITPAVKDELKARKIELLRE